MTRDEIRKRALRAAFSATMSVAMLGCGSTVIERHDRGTDGAGGDAVAHVDMGDTTSTAVTIASSSSSSSAAVAGAGGAGGTATEATGGAGGAGGLGGAGGQAPASTVASAGGGGSLPLCLAESDDEKDWNAYVQCCNEVNWSPSDGCEAWGPPMPPRLDWTPQMEVA